MPIVFVNKLRQLARLSEKLEETCRRPFFPVLCGSPYLVGSGTSSHFLWVDMFYLERSPIPTLFSLGSNPTLY
jgi:hypothetical protein